MHRNYLRIPTSNSVTVRLKERRPTGVVVAACHPCTWEEKTGRLGVRAKLGFKRPCLRKINK